MDEPGRHSTCTEEYFDQKFVSLKQNFLPFGQKGKLCLFLGETRLADLSRQHSMCPGKHFETKVFFSKKKHNFDSVCWFGLEKFQTLVNASDKGVKTEIYVTSKTFSGKLLWKKIQFYIFPWFFRGNLDLQENSSFVRKAF